FSSLAPPSTPTLSLHDALPILSFAPCDIAQVEHGENGALLLEQFAFGLFGPNGALPLHLTELAYERRRHKDDATIVDFLNLFQQDRKSTRLNSSHVKIS